MPNILTSLFGTKPKDENEVSIPDEITLEAKFDIEAKSVPDRPTRFTMVANSGSEPMQIAGFSYPVIVDMNGAKFSKDKTPVVMDHDTSKRVGHTESQQVDSNGIHASGVISSGSPEALSFANDARSGFPFQVSIGAQVKRATYLPKDKTAVVNGRSFDGPLIIASETIIRELSVTVLGADSNTQVSIAATRKANNMPQGQTEQELQESRRLLAIEEQRVDGIRAAAVKFQDIPSSHEIHSARPGDNRVFRSVSELKAVAINEGWHPADAELALLRASRPQNVGPTMGGNNYHDDPKAVIEASFLTKLGFEIQAEKILGPNVMQAANQLRSASFLDLCRVALQASGMMISHNRDEILRAAVSTNLLQEALSGGMDKLLGVQFLQSRDTWRSFASVKPVNNFREHTVVSPQHRGQLEKMGPSSEFKHGFLSEDTSAFKVDTYGKTFFFNRHAMYSDDLGVFEDIAMHFVTQARRTLNNVVYEATMDNSSNHFSSANGNLISDALTIEGLQAAVLKMRKQVDADGNDLDIEPKVLVVPPELEVTGKQILNSIELSRSASQDQVPTGNPLQSITTLEVESRLSNTAKFSGASPDHWYLFGGPASAPVYVAFLEGKQGPTVDFFGLQHDASVLSMGYRVYHDFGAALGEHRSAVYSIGDDSSI